MSVDPRVCRHGGLRRQCETCDLGDDLAQAEKDKAEMLDLLRELEWSGENIHRDPECPVCGGDKESSGGSTPGHAPDCHLAALLARFPRPAS